MATETELIWNEVNCTTGEVITRPYTAEERADYERLQVELEKMRVEREAEEARIESLKASAKAKLIAGEKLTAEEAEVIVL